MHNEACIKQESRTQNIQTRHDKAKQKERLERQRNDCPKSSASAIKHAVSSFVPAQTMPGESNILYHPTKKVTRDEVL